METIGVPEAVKRHGVNPVSLYRNIQMGRIAAKRDEAGHWQMELGSFQRWLDERRRYVRPEARAEAVSA